MEGHGGLARLSSEEWGQDQNVQQSESNFSMEYLSPVREVLKAARREISENDKIVVRKRSNSQLDGKLSPLPNRLPPRPLTTVGGVSTERQLDPRVHFLEEDLRRHQDTLPKSMHDHVSAVGNSPIFFKPHELVDPVQAYRDRERRFKRDGTVRDRLGRGECEGVIRMKLRSHAASSIDGLMKELPRKDDLRVKVEDVPREVRRALALLEGGASPRSIVADGATTSIDSGLVFDRMCKGLTSWDAKLLAGREKCVLPQVKAQVHDSTSKVNTSALPTKQMIQAHAEMLDEQAHEATKAGCEVFQENDYKRVEQLRKNSWDVVKHWEERLSSLPRIRKALMELCRISVGWKDELASHSAIIGAILRTGLDERAQRVLALPEIRSMFEHHPLAFVSDGRRKKIGQTLDALFGKKLVIAQLRSRLQQYFKGFKIEWEDAVPMLEALRIEDLKVCLKRSSEAEAARNDADGDVHGEDKEDVESFNFLLGIMERQEEEEEANLAGVKAKVEKLKKTAGELLQNSVKQRRDVFGLIESKLKETFGPLEKYVPPEERDTTPTCMLDKLLECSKRASEKTASIREQTVAVQAEAASLTEVINAADGKATTEQITHLHHLSELQAKLNVSLEKCREVEDLDSITSEIIRYRRHSIDHRLSHCCPDWAVDSPWHQ